LGTMEQLEALGFRVTRADVPFAGIVLVKNAGPKISDVLDGSPAQKAGVAPGDEIVRIEKSAFHLAGLKWLVKNEKRFSIEVQRGNRSLTLAIEPALRSDVTELAWAGTADDLDRLKKWLNREDLDFAPGAKLALTAYDNFHGTEAAI
ncbi:MAG: PDZ domain-containing protein, partial [Polyangiaceae bacterium]